MGVTIRIDTSGIPEVQSGLHRLQSGLNDPSELTYKIGETIAGQARKNAMSGHSTHAGGYPNVRTGNLATSNVSRLTSPVTALVGNNASYAAPVEFGHKMVARYKGKYGSYQSFHTGRQARAYPFFFPAIAQSMERIKQLTVNYIKKLTGGK